MDRKLKQVNDEILELKQLKKHVDQAVEQNQNTASKVIEITNLISSESLSLTEYSDSLVYRIIEQITVISKEEIRIRFVGGYEAIQIIG